MFRSVITAVLIALFFTPPIHANDRTQSAAPPSAASIRQSIAAVRFDADGVQQPPLFRGTQSSPSRARKVWKSIGWAAALGVGGFFAGAFIGAAIDGDCDCDDPGWRGFLIGAPVGAVAGAITGAVIGSR
jgi:hypothetical protein